MSFKKKDNEIDNLGKVLNENAADEGYRRYKQFRYVKLIGKAILFFLLGLLFGKILKGI